MQKHCNCIIERTKKSLPLHKDSSTANTAKRSELGLIYTKGSLSVPVCRVPEWIVSLRVETPYAQIPRLEVASTARIIRPRVKVTVKVREVCGSSIRTQKTRGNVWWKRC